VTVLPHGECFGGAAGNFFRLLRDVDISPFDYLAFSDQDDIWFPEKLVRAHRQLRRDGADAYSGNVIAFWPDARETLIQKAQPQVTWDFLFEAAGPGCTYVLDKKLAVALQTTLIAQREEAQLIGLHDWFVYAFARANNYRWLIDANVGMRYRQHGTNQVGINEGCRAFMMRARRVLNGWGFNQAALIARLIGCEKNAFVQRWADGRRSGMLWLALQARQCRRRRRDQVLFALSCIAVAIVGNNRP
jgi:rhamnosyltransferase